VSLLPVAAAYLVGAVPIGFLVARAVGVGDIRRQGSGNIGATNILRTAGRLPAIVTLVGDIVKGYAAVVLASYLGGGDPGITAAGSVAAVVGNCWSVFLLFRGGKGVATGLGALLRLAPLATLAAVPVFLAVAMTTRFVSLASLLSAACVPFGAWALGAPRPSVLAAFAVAALVIVRHRENIARLRAGTERRLGERRAPTPEEGLRP
jgi:glycerol-3-phosphate acyltransferase PlsY